MVRLKAVVFWHVPRNTCSVSLPLFWLTIEPFGIATQKMAMSTAAILCALFRAPSCIGGLVPRVSAALTRLVHPGTQSLTQCPNLPAATCRQQNTCRLVASLAARPPSRDNCCNVISPFPMTLNLDGLSVLFNLANFTKHQP